MKKYMNSFVSMAVMGIFLILAWSCKEFEVERDWPCEPYQVPFKGNSTIHIEAVEGNDPIGGLDDPIEGVNLIVTVEKFRVIENEDKCKIVLKEKFTRELVTNESGLAFFKDYNEFLSGEDKNVITVKGSRSFYQSNAIQFIKRDNNPNTIRIGLLENLLFP